MYPNTFPTAIRRLRRKGDMPWRWWQYTQSADLIERDETDESE
jgi:hypothetical protein